MTDRLLVENAELREAFLASGLSLSDVARELRWYKGNNHPDTQRAARALGLVTDVSGGGRGRTRRRKIDIDVAQRIADVLGVERWEVGVQ